MLIAAGSAIGEFAAEFCRRVAAIASDEKVVRGAGGGLLAGYVYGWSVGVGYRGDRALIGLGKGARLGFAALREALFERPHFGRRHFRRSRRRELGW